MSSACISIPLATFLPTPTRSETSLFCCLVMVKSAAPAPRKARKSTTDAALATALGSVSLDSPKRLRKPVLKAFYKNSPPKKKRKSIISDGESRHSGNFYEWRPRPKRHEKTREADAHHFCDQHKRERLHSFIKEWQWRRNHRDYQPAALVLMYLTHVAHDAS